MWNVRWIVAFVLLLAACGGGGDDSTDVPPSPTDNPNLGVQPTQVLSETEIAEGIEPAVEESFEEQINSLLAEQPQQAPLPTSTPDGEGALPLPQPQTLVAAETEEASIPPGFDYI